jgi:sugar lactone lactonase YvrE
MSRDVQVVDEGFSYLECPRWHDGRLWLSDFHTRRVVTVTADGRTDTVVVVPQQPSGLGWLPDGRLLVVSMRDRRVLRLEPSGELVEHADLSGLASGHLNDMVVDAGGRAYVGNFGFDLMAGEGIRSASLVRLDPDGTAAVVAEDLLFHNGCRCCPTERSSSRRPSARRLTGSAFAPTAAWTTVGPGRRSVRPPRDRTSGRSWQPAPVLPTGCAPTRRERSGSPTLWAHGSCGCARAAR